jgi:hypothetical protein
VREVKKFALIAASTAMLIATSACNSQDSQQKAIQVEPDWIHQEPGADPSETPTPEPTSSATPGPSPTPTRSPSPVPTGSDLYTGPSSVEKYVLKFIDDARIQGVDALPGMKGPKLEIRIASLDAYGSTTIGLCETGGLRRVTFDPDFWNSVSETQRELLAHHELGHCVLYRPHRPATLSSGAYASIMYPIIMSSATYTSNYDYYQEELFTYGTSSASSDLPETHVCDGSDLPMDTSIQSPQ